VASIEAGSAFPEKLFIEPEGNYQDIALLPHFWSPAIPADASPHSSGLAGP
jgi:hypothetical protein